MIQVSHTSGVPIYKQIVDQIEFMVEGGQLEDGDRLPSGRLLASNLHVNRNTVARAYRELRDKQLVRSQRRKGMVVSGSARVREQAEARERARAILSEATSRCIGIGLSAEAISTLAYHFALHAQNLEVKVCFVECNADRATYFADELATRLNVAVSPLVLGHFDPDTELDVDLVLTTFFHLAEVRKLARKRAAEVVAIVVAPHVQTLVKLAQVPKGQRIGILYTTEDQAVGIRDSLTQSGLHNIGIVSANGDAGLDEVDVVVVPTEAPELRSRVAGKVEIIEFGNVLDEASVRMVRDVVEELQDRRAAESRGA